MYKFTINIQFLSKVEKLFLIQKRGEVGQNWVEYSFIGTQSE